jgi:DNA-binding transcriptional ArsR family regulator
MRDFAGDANFVDPAALIGDRTRARVLLALLDGRALPLSMLAAEAGVALSTMSEHLTQLVDGGLLRVRREGRHRYYSLASPEVAGALEALARIAPPFTPNSLRTGTRARRLRTARTCYDHLAGRLGVGVMRALVDTGALTGGDGRHHPESAHGDRLSAPGRDVVYEVTPHGWEVLAHIGVERPRTRRPLVRYCVDWTEQRHHLSGALGAAVLTRLLERGWLERASGSREVHVTVEGVDGFQEWLGIDMGEITGSVAA